MKRTIAVLLCVIMCLSLLAACGSDSAAEPSASQSVAETAAPAKETPAPTAAPEPVSENTEDSGPETFHLVAYEVNGNRYDEETIKTMGMDKTYVTLNPDGSGVVSMMGSTMDVTWNDSGEIKTQGFTLYTFERTENGINMNQQGVATYILVAGEISDEGDKPQSGASSGPAVTPPSTSDGPITYNLYEYRAGDNVIDDFVHSADIMDVSIEYNAAGTSYMTIEGNRCVAEFKGDTLSGGGATYTYDFMENGDLHLNMYNVLDWYLTSRPDGYTAASTTDQNAPLREGLQKASSAGYDGRYGNAGRLNWGKTIFVTIFMDDGVRTWDGQEELKEDIRKQYAIAAYYLKSVCADYGWDCSFIYDWNENPDLSYSAVYPCSLDPKEYDHTTIHRHPGTDEEGQSIYPRLNAILDSTVNESALRQKYGADNIVYQFIINDFIKDESKDRPEMGYRDFALLGDGYGYEYCVLRAEYLDALTIVHETMHNFGCPDFYKDAAAEAYTVTQGFITYMLTEKINDVMGESIDLGTNYFGVKGDVTEYSAYYTGLISEKPALLKQFNCSDRSVIPE